MPPSRSSEKPPEAMTLLRAMPVIAFAGVFDLLKMLFEAFWFFGPALAAVYCSAKVNGILTTWTAGLLGMKTAALACSAAVTGAVAGAAVVTGGLSAEAIEVFGIIMAMAVGFLGNIAVLFWLLAKNPRIFKANERAALWFGGSFLVSELPFIGAFPALSVTLWRMYKKQIQADAAAHAAWKRKSAQDAAARVQERQQQAAGLMQANAIRADQMQQQAANDAQYAAQEQEATERENAEVDAANDAQYTQNFADAA